MIKKILKIIRKIVFNKTKNIIKIKIKNVIKRMQPKNPEKIILLKQELKRRRVARGERGDGGVLCRAVAQEKNGSRTGRQTRLTNCHD